MYNLWFFIPKSGVAFVFLSVLLIMVWNGYREALDHPYVWIFAAEALLFGICFYLANRESETKGRKSQS